MRTAGSHLLDPTTTGSPATLRLASDWLGESRGAPAQEAPARERARLLPAGTSRRERVARIGTATFTVLICSLFVWHILAALSVGAVGGVLRLYTILVCGYVISRFVLAAAYRAPKDVGHEPTISVVVPAYNEGVAVARTVHAVMAARYPWDKMEVIVVNDGSQDDTSLHMHRAAEYYSEGAVRCIDLPQNVGKRSAMAVGIRATQHEVLVFVDSDSVPSPGSLRHLVQALADPKVGCVSGITHVRNAYSNGLTRMQMARYFVSFQLLKAAESVLGAVTCCSGCFSAYRREAVLPVLDEWERQTFLGAPCTHGDDRALTNRVLRAGYTSLYDSAAEAWTDAPESYPKFFRQQLRWKKSWSREGLLLLGHAWRTRPVAFPFIVVATLAGLLSPLVLVLNLAAPWLLGVTPMIYALGLVMVSLCYALFYRALRNDGLWVNAVPGTFFYIAFSPQLWWAILRIRDGRWGTRDLSMREDPSVLVEPHHA